MPDLSEYTLAYGNEFITFDIPPGRDYQPLVPDSHMPAMDAQHILDIRMRSPIASPRLNDLIDSRDRILIVVPDKTRRVRLDLIFPSIYNVFKEKKIPDDQVTIIFANGSHGHMSDLDKETILGSDAFSRFRHFEHDCRDAVVEKLGETTRGTQVILNPLIKRHDKVIVVSPITHHYFAGFGGGPKMIVPGLAAWETIWQNHRLAVDADHAPLHPGCELGNLHHNPVYEDILEAVKMVTVDFAIQMVQDHEGNLVDVYCGNLFASFQKASMKAKQVAEVGVEKPARMAIASAGGYPRDINLVQAHKAIHHASRVLEPGGSLIMLAQCPEGFGNPNLPRWFEIDSFDEMRQSAVDNFQLNATTALALKHKLVNYDIYLFSQLPEEIVARMGFIPVGAQENISQILAASEATQGYILPNASLTVPVLT